MNVRRFDTNPIIVPEMDSRMGSNINGPSLIRVPASVRSPLGKYYLYFAHHQGTYIRLAYADDLKGPWKIHSPGVLDLNDSFFMNHIASPDVHVVEETGEIRMYYHGHTRGMPMQFTRVAVSRDGLHFEARPEVLGTYYWRVFRYGGWWYTLEKPGTIRRSRSGLDAFEEGPVFFPPSVRHTAVQLRGDALRVFYTSIGDAPEEIRLAVIHLHEDWHQWKMVERGPVLKPETDYEGADCPVEPSRPGAIHQRVCQLRDPGIFEEDGRTYLLYSVAGESGIAIAELAEA